MAQGQPPGLEDVQGHFEAYGTFETQAQLLQYGERDTKESLSDLALRMLAVLHREFDPRTDVLAVEEPFRVPPVDPDTGEVLDRDIVGGACWSGTPSDGWSASTSKTPPRPCAVRSEPGARGQVRQACLHVRLDQYGRPALCLTGWRPSS